MKLFLEWLLVLLKPLLNERGEVNLGSDEDGAAGDGGPEGDDALDPFQEGLQDIDMEGIDFLPAGGADQDKPKDDAPPAKKDEEDPWVAKERDYQERLQRLEGDKSDLKRALHEARQEKKRDPESQLNDNQVLAILEEHKDDPNVLLNTIKYYMKNAATTAKKEAIDDVEINSARRELDGFTTQIYGEKWTKEDSDLRAGLVKAKEHLKLQDHPFGDHLALAMQNYMNLPKYREAWIEEGKKLALKDEAEKGREQSIQDGQLTKGKGKTDGGAKGKYGLTPQQLETATKLGLKTPVQLQTYANQILRNKPGRKEG